MNLGQRSTVTAQELQEIMRPKSKYRARRALYNGRWYHSETEANYAAALDIRKRVDVRDWWPQVTFPLRVNGVLICKYIVDFKVLLRDGSTELFEVKGYETAISKLKRKLFAALYPEEKLTVVRGK